ncbi:putative disease resistance protein [Dorcoceras hygrometricum]|uniref:Putative disease resistance protein n=1 Tax=Dorcoceras hygrometricum TaxID=472368 RepID=A0A2Z7DER8_9LAMI|nr:putative disease resistance protein [Dorcoceras hygrometricum]
MSWWDDACTLPPPKPEQNLNLTKFLEAIGDRCYNAQQLIEEDLLCFFHFSGRKVRLVGDLDDRMDKAALFEALKERKSKTKSGGASSSGTQNKEETSSGAPSKEKRKASPEKKERRKKRRHEERGTGSTQESIPEVMITEPEDTTNKVPEQKSTEEPYTLLDSSKISFVSKPSGSASLDFIRHLVPDQDFDQLERTPDLEVFEIVGLHFMQSLAWFREAASRFSKARAEVIKTKRSYDGVLGRHEALLKQLEEIQTKESVEKESLSAELESARAESQTYKAQAQSLETQVQSLEIQVQSLDARAQYDMMDKAAMLEALKERKTKTKSAGASSSGAQNKEETSSGAPSKEKRKASPEKKERRSKHRHEERGTGSIQESIPEVMITEPEDTTNKVPEQKSTEEPYTLLDASKISFVSKPSGSASLDFIHHLVPDKDFDQLERTPDLEVFEIVGLHFMQSLAWFGEAASRFSKARAEVIKTKRSYDGVLGRHEALLKQLEEIQTKESVEKESLSAELESARAEAQTYKAQAQSLETQVEKRSRGKANSWALEKEKFLQSKDFERLCLKKAVMYFDKGFEGCLAQFRANGFSEEEYPAPFLDVEQALADMPEDQEEGSSDADKPPPPT